MLILKLLVTRKQCIAPSTSARRSQLGVLNRDSIKRLYVLLPEEAEKIAASGSLLLHGRGPGRWQYLLRLCGSLLLLLYRAIVVLLVAASRRLPPVL